MPTWISYGLGPAPPGLPPAPPPIAGAGLALMITKGLPSGDGGELISEGMGGFVLVAAQPAFLCSEGMGDARSGALATKGLTYYRLSLLSGIVGDAQPRPGVVDANRSFAKAL